MRTQLGFVWLCCLAALAVGCGDSEGRSDDAGTDRIIELDAAGDDSGGGDDDAGGGDDGGGGGDDGGTIEGCAVGKACPRDLCEVGDCLSENNTTIGSTDDPITGHPEGDETIPATFWKDGYCVPALPTGTMPETCDTDDEASCGECASCVSLGGEPPQTLCFQDCTPSGTDNGDCREGYGCELSLEVCFPGCTSDDGCRVSRMDTNEDGTIDDSDSLVYDTDSDATCNMETWRCDHSGSGDAVAGDTCVKNSECEADGRCLAEASFETWVGGYCTKFRCDLEGRECAGEDSVCQERRIGLPLCLEGCQVASPEADWTEGDHATYTGITGGCREGYACNWNGSDGAGTPNNGACLPGEFNDVTEPNVGAPCAEDSECYSPFGLGLCLTGGVWDPEGYCTVLDCGAPGIPTDACGEGTQCLDADGSAGDLTWCLQSCETAADCTAGFACTDYDGDEATSKVCFPQCASNEDCRTDEMCDIPAGETFGECVASS